MPKRSFTIAMTPIAKERPRTVTKGGTTWTYTPDKTLKAEQKIRDFIYGKGGRFEQWQAVKVTATFYREEPESQLMRHYSQIWHSRGVKPLPVFEPDLDNYGKALLDALQDLIQKGNIQEGAYPDDCQVTTLIIKKRFGKPKVEFTLEEDDGE